jgi:hypothetical protein
MKPLDFWFKQAAFVAFLTTFLFFSGHGVLFPLATLLFIFTIFAGRFKVPAETRRQKLTGITIMSVFLTAAIPFARGRVTELWILAGLLLSLAALIWHLRQKPDTQTPLLT